MPLPACFDEPVEGVDAGLLGFAVLEVVCLEEETVGDMKCGGFLPRFSLGRTPLRAWDAIEAVESRLEGLLALPVISVSVPMLYALGLVPYAMVWVPGVVGAGG